MLHLKTLKSVESFNLKLWITESDERLSVKVLQLFWNVKLWVTSCSWFYERNHRALKLNFFALKTAGNSNCLNQSNFSICKAKVSNWNDESKAALMVQTNLRNSNFEISWNENSKILNQNHKSKNQNDVERSKASVVLKCKIWMTAFDHVVMWTCDLKTTCAHDPQLRALHTLQSPQLLCTKKNHMDCLNQLPY